MASVSGTTSSLSTTLRGYGGMASGIDRDSIIEQMSQASNTKIQNQKNAITSLTWKQEAFQGIINQILDLQDNYLSYSAASNVMDAGLFAKNVITANGDEKVSKYVSVSGSSDLLESMSVAGVEQLATAANVQSGVKGSDAIKTDMSFSTKPRESRLEGTKLIFGHSATEGRFTETGTFTFPSSYKDENGKTVNIDYTKTDLAELAADLNKAIAANKTEIYGTDTEAITIQFKATDDGKNLQVEYAKVDKTGGNYKIIENSQDDAKGIASMAGLVIRSNSSALGALGFKTKLTEDGDELKAENGGYKLEDFNNHILNTSESYVHEYDNMAQYLKGQKFTVTYGGQSKQVELITENDWKELSAMTDKSDQEMNELFAARMQSRLDAAFGKGKIKVDGSNDKIAFDNANTDDNSSLTITSNNYGVMKETGLEHGNSNKISLEASVYDNRKRLGFGDEYDVNVNGKYQTEEDAKAAFDEYLKENFKINDVQINVSADMTVNQLLTNINSSKAGVKASYLSTSNKFTLVSKETGSGRDIKLGDGTDAGIGAAGTVFRGTKADGGLDGVSSDGKDAVMYVDYGTGAEKVVSSTNTFDLDGLKVTVSGEFGLEKDEDGKTIVADGNPKFDRTKAVTFNASADVDKATEAVKKFLEDYNKLVKAINTEITTKPDDAYGPLTDEQKDEMNETSIENWEKKAKQGLLFNNGVMRELSMSVQGVLTKIMGSGVSYDDLEEIGITMSTDPYDGGTLGFDETKFKAAMKDDPEKVGRIFAGGGEVRQGIGSVISDTLKQYATRYAYLNGGSYGRLVEEAGSERITLSIQNNAIYKQLKDMQDSLTTLQSKLKSEQDRYIQMFTRMETAISNMNSQSSYLSSLSG